MKVMLAVDGSPCSWHTLEEVVRLLPLKQAEVTLVTVVAEPRLATDPIGYDLAYVPVMKQNRQEAKELLASAQKMLATAGVHVTPILREGDPAQELLALAEDIQPDIICVGSHGRGPVGRLMLGSVSEALVHRWKGPVMVVRQPAGAPGGAERTVRSVMTPEPQCLDAKQTLDDAAKLMRDHDIGFVPVIEDGAVVGVITDRDIVVRALPSDRRPAEATVGEFCSRPAVWVAPAMPIDEAALLMERHHIRRVLVMDGPYIVGVVALGDLAETLPDMAEHALVEISKSPKTLRHRWLSS
jgi:nucleotide-binding universal stress UspA family protein/CBS domain-containing protein